MQHSTLRLIVLLASSAVACAHAPAPTATQAPSSPPLPQTETPSAVSVATDQSFTVGPNVRVACAVNDAIRAPRFDFDETTLSGNDREVARKIVVCMTTGALRGRFVSIVPRRGSAEVTDRGLTRAQQRALAIKAYFTSAGVEPNHITDEGREPDGPTPLSDRLVHVELAD